jgi:hypothetical protein
LVNVEFMAKFMAKFMGNITNLYIYIYTLCIFNYWILWDSTAFSSIFWGYNMI